MKTSLINRKQVGHLEHRSLPYSQNTVSLCPASSLTNPFVLGHPVSTPVMHAPCTPPRPLSLLPRPVISSLYPCHVPYRYPTPVGNSLPRPGGTQQAQVDRTAGCSPFPIPRRRLSHTVPRNRWLPANPTSAPVSPGSRVTRRRWHDG
jgi:hypothetical protein